MGTPFICEKKVPPYIVEFTLAITLPLRMVLELLSKHELKDKPTSRHNIPVKNFSCFIFVSFD